MVNQPPDVLGKQLDAVGGVGAWLLWGRVTACTDAAVVKGEDLESAEVLQY